MKQLGIREDDTGAQTQKKFTWELIRIGTSKMKTELS